MFNQKTILNISKKHKYTILLSLIVVLVLIVVGLASHSKSLPAAIYLNGPRNHIQLNTPYTYTVEIDEPTDYKNVNFFFDVPASKISDYVKIPELYANKPWEKSFTVSFTSTYELATKGIVLQVGHIILQKKGGASEALFNKNYSVLLTPATKLQGSSTPPKTTPAKQPTAINSL